MDLFNNSPNLLPFDGEVYNFGILLDHKTSSNLFLKLMDTIPWQRDELVVYGKTIISKREAAWIGDKQLNYTYSGVTKRPSEWTSELLELKNKIEQICGTRFNSCLLNLYHDGAEGMSWHSDNEKELGEQPIIASLSIGATRKFYFRHKTSKTKVELILESGHLLVMQGKTQKFWQHSVPKMLAIKSPRINLTFRNIQI
ncbi:MAG: alpha-ketoglutarate-dependent dioxygenase AlkB [Bacteroidia bacterium]